MFSDQRKIGINLQDLISFGAYVFWILDVEHDSFWRGGSSNFHPHNPYYYWTRVKSMKLIYFE